MYRCIGVGDRKKCPVNSGGVRYGDFTAIYFKEFELLNGKILNGIESARQSVFITYFN